MKCAEAGNMSNGRFSHLLRGVWLLWFWQGEFKHCLQDGSFFFLKPSSCLNTFFIYIVCL